MSEAPKVCDECGQAFNAKHGKIIHLSGCGSDWPEGEPMGAGVVPPPPESFEQLRKDQANWWFNSYQEWLEAARKQPRLTGPYVLVGKPTGEQFVREGGGTGALWNADNRLGVIFGVKPPGPAVPEVVTASPLSPPIVARDRAAESAVGRVMARQARQVERGRATWSCEYPPAHARAVVLIVEANYVADDAPAPAPQPPYDECTKVVMEPLLLAVGEELRISMTPDGRICYQVYG